MRYIAMTVVLGFVLPLGAQEPAPLRIGVYDSRAVALAYYNRAEYSQEIALIRREHENAKKVHNKKRVAEIEAQMQVLQTIKHARVFSNASIPDIIESMRADVDRIAREAGVRLVVSKWDVGWSDPAVERVDVTDRMVAVFEPNAQVQQWLAKLANVEPLPLTEAMHTH